ncbi:hypothetical protein MMA231_00969 [Asticcacaulis sp. MM231]
MPIFRKWIGEKRVKSLEEKAYQLVNDDYEMTIGIHKNKIRDDNLGLYGPMFQGWGQEAGALKDRLIFDALKNGHLNTCYDGQFFFDTDHVINGVTFANTDADTTVQPWFLMDLSKPMKPILYQTRQEADFNMVTDPTDSHVFKTGEYLAGAEARGGAGYTYWQLAYRSRKTLNAANYEIAKQAMASWTDDNGENLGIKPTHIVVGTSNAAAAKNLFKKQNLAGGESNTYDGELQIIEAPRLL